MVRRVPSLTLAVLALLAVAAPAAHAHAALLTTTPADGGHVAASPARVQLRFSEPVELLRGADVSVVDQAGRVVSAGAARTSPRDASIVEQRLRPALPASSYTVRYRIVSADAHVVDGATTFATGGATLRAPVLGGVDEGPGEASAWSVVARFLELVGLGGALALIAFRWLVWAPAWRLRARLAPDEDAGASVSWFSARFWTALWSAIGLAIFGEATVLVTKTATSLGKSPLQALADPAGISRVFSETRFGTHFQVRLGVLLLVIAVAFWEYLAEPVAEQERRRASPTGRGAPSLIVAGLLITCLVLISSQGHASQAPGGSLSVLDDALHLTSIAIWVGGLAVLAFVLRHVPTALGTAVLSRFSTVALAAVALAVVTGTLRAIGELADPAQLWDTAYGRSILIKVALLLPLAFLAFANRRVLVAVAARGRANRATLRLVTRNARVELALSLGIVLVASLLVAQVPGRV
jgi:copper transport protein